MHLRFPLPRLPPLASPRSGTDVPLSRNSSYLVNQSLAGAPEKAIWFSAEPGGGGAGRCPAMPSDAHAFLRPRGAGLPARALAGEEGFSRPRFLLEYPQQVGVGRSGRLPRPGPGRKRRGAWPLLNPCPPQQSRVQCPAKNRDPHRLLAIGLSFLPLSRKRWCQALWGHSHEGGPRQASVNQGEARGCTSTQE